MLNGYLTNKSASRIELAMVMFFITYYILPSLNYSLNFMIPLFLSFVYIAYVFVKDTKTAGAFVGFFISVFCLSVAYSVLTDTLTISSTVGFFGVKAFISKLSRYVLMFLPVLLSVRILKCANHRQQTFLLSFTAILIGYVIFQTLQELAINPYAIRQWEEFTELEDDNIGSYYFVYSIPIIIAIFAVCAERFKGARKIICLAAIVVLLYFLVKAQYTLAILIAMIGLFVQIIVSIKNGAMKIMLFFGAFVFMLFLPDLLLFVSNNVESTQLAVRFRELYAFFGEGDATGYNLNGRLTLYKKSIIAFLHSPLYGNRQLDFDGHATCLTVLSDTGLIGAVPFYYLIFNSRLKIKTVLEENAAKFMPIFLCLMCMGFTNPIHSSKPLLISVWFIAPLAINVVFNKGDEV